VAVDGGGAGSDDGFFGSSGGGSTAGRVGAIAAGAAVGGAGGLAGMAGLGMLGGMLGGKSSDENELGVGGGSTPGPSARMGGSDGASSSADVAGAAPIAAPSGSLDGRPDAAGAAGRWNEATMNAAADVLRNPVDRRVEQAMLLLATHSPTSAAIDDALKLLSAATGRSIEDLRSELQHVMGLRDRALLAGALAVPGAGEIGVRLQERLASAALVGQSLGVDARLAALLIPTADVPSGVEPSALLAQAASAASRCTDALAAIRTN
jgi:hypothetical protein